MLGYIRWVFAIIVFVLTIVFTCLSFIKGEGFADVGTLLILGFTLIALIFYAFSTHEIARVDKQTYEDSKLPVVSLTIVPRPNIKQNYETRVRLKNFSSYNLEAFVNLNLKVNGQPVRLGGAYSAEEPWLLTAHGRIKGQFYINDVLSKVGTNVEGMSANRFYPETSEKLEKLPRGIQFPDLIKDKIRYDADKQFLIFIDVMKEGERDELLKLSNEVPYQEAVKTLFENSHPSRNVKNQLSMSIEVSYRGVTREVCPSNIWPHESRNPQYKDTPTKILVNPVQKWYFDFWENVWVYDL